MGFWGKETDRANLMFNTEISTNEMCILSQENSKCAEGAEWHRAERTKRYSREIDGAIRTGRKEQDVQSNHRSKR